MLKKRKIATLNKQLQKLNAEMSQLQQKRERIASQIGQLEQSQFRKESRKGKLFFNIMIALFWFLITLSVIAYLGGITLEDVNNIAQSLFASTF